MTPALVVHVCVCHAVGCREKRERESESLGLPSDLNQLSGSRSQPSQLRLVGSSCWSLAGYSTSLQLDPCKLQATPRHVGMSMHVPDWHCRWHGATAFGWSSPLNFGPPARWHALFSVRDSLLFFFWPPLLAFRRGCLLSTFQASPRLT